MAEKSSILETDSAVAQRTSAVGTPTVSRQLAAGATTANVALTATARRLSVVARGADIRFAVGVGAQTASATSHYLASGTRFDFEVPADANIAAIRAGATDGVLEITELA